MDVVEDIRERNIGFPCVVRFQDVLRARVKQINEAFGKAIAEMAYGARYFGVYPIKVNQMREVVEEILDAGAPYHYGLEAGSKGELLVVLGMNADPEALTICNGYKDEEFLRLALLGRKLGRKVIVVIEKLSELPHLLRLGEEMGVEPMIGLRSKLTTRGTGKWEGSSGDFAKFGLTVPELIHAVRILKDAGKEHCAKLLHFHVGSPAHRDPGGEGRGERGRARLREAPQDGARHRVLRRRRRARASTTSGRQTNGTRSSPARSRRPSTTRSTSTSATSSTTSSASA